MNEQTRQNEIRDRLDRYLYARLCETEDSHQRQTLENDHETAISMLEKGTSRIHELANKADEIMEATKTPYDVHYSFNCERLDNLVDASLTTMAPEEQKIFVALFNGAYTPPNQRDSIYYDGLPTPWDIPPDNFDGRWADDDKPRGMPTKLVENAEQWERDNLAKLNKHFETRGADMNTRHQQERQTLIDAKDPVGMEILDQQQERELSQFERAKENAKQRFDGVIFDMWDEGYVPDQDFTIPGQDHDLSHDSGHRGDDGGRGGRGR
jgi:hypothetical protein